MNSSFNNFPSIREMSSRIGSAEKADHSIKAKSPGSISFAEMLRQTTKPEIKISKHASIRMESRNIDLSQEQWDRLQGGVEKASEKGIKESLVMVDDMAFIVNVDNNTMITAVGKNDEKIFTNIDGAVIV
ncbi:MAG: flagellar protein [Lachnospiraceae bacterium]|nr:flagellar protein [Lachnospiraceae bacterium]